MLARSCLILALGLGVLAGCGDDESDDRTPGQPDPTGSGNPPGSGIDGGIDAGAPGSSDAGSSDGSITLVDGRVLGGSDGGCDIADPELGCGQASGSVVRFANGLELDRATGLAWAPAQAPSGGHGDGAWRTPDLTGAAWTIRPADIDRWHARAGCEPPYGRSCQIAHETRRPRCESTRLCMPCESASAAQYRRTASQMDTCVTAWASRPATTTRHRGLPCTTRFSTSHVVRLSKPESRRVPLRAPLVGTPARPLLRVAAAPRLR